MINDKIITYHISFIVMLIIFQILFIFFSFLAITTVKKKKIAGELKNKEALFWVLFWVLADVAVIWPDLTTHLANALGIGRGTDFIVYISLALIFYLLFLLHIKIEGINRDVTKVVRRDTLQENNKSKKQ